MILISTITGAAVAPALAAADLDKTVDFHIPAQPLDSALLEFSKQAHVQLAVNSRFIGKISAPSVDGSFVASAALSELLRHSGLEYVTVGNTVTVSPIQVMSKSEGAGQSEHPSGPNPSTRITRALGSSDTAGSTRLADSGQQQSTPMQEVLVSAQKKTERLQDVPVPVTAVNTDVLAEQNQTRLQDYFSSVPGLIYSSGGHGDASLAIRGVTTGGLTNPTVGITIDDVPFGSTTALGSRTVAPDLDPGDLARVEVLRGPQGTLYGASSMGGLLKYVTTDPSTERFSGRVQADVDGVHNGNGVGYAARAAVNVPLGDSIAVRVSGFARKDPGYINNPALGLSGVNQVNVTGGHFTGLWRISDDWSLKLSALLQDVQGHGAPYATPDLGTGPLEQLRLAGTGNFEHQIRAYSVVISGSFAGIKLVSLTGYSTDKYHGVNDLSLLYGGVGGVADSFYQVDAANELQHTETYKFSQELRFSGTFYDRLDWLLGGFYTSEDTPTHDEYNAVDSATTAVAGSLLDDTYPTTYTEYALFADLTVHITDQFDVQFGGRGSHNKQTYTETLTGPFDVFYGFPSPTTNPPVHTHDNAFTYLVTPRFKLNDNLMVYARFASGYRPGGPNPVCTLYTYSCHYQPDKTYNYELGVKGDSPEHLLSFDASAYYIDWKDIQLQVSDPVSGNTFFTNAAHAKSQGLELSGKIRPLTGMTVAAWVSVNDAKLKSDLPVNSPVVGFSGDRLPYSAKVSSNLTVSQDVPITGSLVGFASAQAMYIGDRKEVFAATADTRLNLPGYVQGNLNAGIRDDSWTVNVFVNNVTDQRGTLSRPQIGFTNFGAIYIQPRTVGASVSKSF